MTKIIGVTGGIGSGKTTVINYIQSKGYAVYVADDAGREVMKKPEIIEKVQQLFNNDVLQNDGFLDRSKIAKLVFNDAQLLKQLNQIVHPAVKIDFKNFLERNQHQPFVFKETAVLFESGAYKECSATILITAPLEIRMQRVMKRDQVTKQEVLNRVKNQLPDEEKSLLATFVVENIDLNETFKSVDDVLEKIKTI
ncbi:dephospho-CoA kinase [Paenimyroides aestuarii]|uniref:Dephospho-CoA kinase n=1 Tax=Paenimyroides aestuarii TaxID=2968490 RepID=A0ABY5NQQ9_9FLAO|nr:dephospho-CoA kinase [Paenimyroides aestuarii]UUV20901.1 dephospho-CoA kinase [Paenimyroides aestuarii]